MFSDQSQELPSSSTKKNKPRELDNSSINQDLLKSAVTHGLMLFIILATSFIQHKKNFINISGKTSNGQKQQIISNGIKDNKFINNQSLANDKPIIQASLIDHKMVDEAIKIQENQATEKKIKEQNIQQQEQKLAKLTKALEQEVVKAKQDRENLKKAQESLQKEATKLKNQSKELLQQQEKLKKIEQQQQQKQKQSGSAQKKSLEQANQQEKQVNLNKKMQTDNKQADSGNNNLVGNGFMPGGSLTLDSKLSSIYSRWYADVVNNRKRTMFFPDNLICTIKVKVLPSGYLDYVKMEKSSGNKAYDHFSEQAIYKSAPFFMPEDPDLVKELVETEHMLDFDDTAFNNEG
jgi:colicin import membrane protein